MTRAAVSETVLYFAGVVLIALGIGVAYPPGGITALGIGCVVFAVFFFGGNDEPTRPSS